MNKPPALSLRRLLTLVAFACASFAGATLSAQPTATGSVHGRVYNPATKAYVANAEIRLEGTNQVAYTESDGTFQLNHVAVGPASIAIAFSGYNTVKESFTVTAGQPAVREINLVSTDSARSSLQERRRPTGCLHRRLRARGQLEGHHGAASQHEYRQLRFGRHLWRRD